MINLKQIKEDKTMDFQIHKLYYTQTDFKPTSQGTRIVHNYKIRCPFVYFDIDAKRCKKCKYYDGCSHNGIYCLAIKCIELFKRKELIMPKHIRKKDYPIK